MDILTDQEAATVILGHIEHRHIGMDRYLGRSAGQDDAVDSNCRRWNSAVAGSDLGGFSDDSFSGFQLPADTIGELDERNRGDRRRRR